MKMFFRDSVVAVAASGLVLCGLCLGFDTKAGAQGIELSIEGLAKELSEQAKVLQATRDQVANVVAVLRKRNFELEERTALLEKKMTHVVKLLKLQKETAK